MTKLRDRIVDALTAIAGVCAIVVTAIVGLRQFGPAQTPVEAATRDSFVQVVDNWERFSSVGHSLGPAAAAVTIVEFGDYECPFCRDAVPHIEAILRDYDDVRFVYRHMPLPTHPNALPAARAAECAGQQGHFWEYHAVLYASSSWQYADPVFEFERIAAAVGVPDDDAFALCVRSESPVPAIARDQAAAYDAGFNGTPSFLINDRWYRGVVDSLTFREIYAELTR